jgi:hypothetical protein
MLAVKNSMNRKEARSPAAKTIFGNPANPMFPSSWVS